MQEKAKLVEGLDADGQTRYFIILKYEELGSGGFGTVYKAFEQGNENVKLAAKIVPYHNETTRSLIKKEIQILRRLPQHDNLVQVVPLECFSEKNFYIFMEYCNEGTLAKLMKTKVKTNGKFTDEQIFKAFFQILNGYKVLWDKKILHQDLKPENILIKNGKYKITDFGYSIFYEGIKLDGERRGTIPYMPFEKFTVLDYTANTKSDIFSLGVIFFKMLTGKHPYVPNGFIDWKDYVYQLRKNKLSVSSDFKLTLSMTMQQFYDLVLRMIAKNEKDRIDFAQVYQFMEDQEIFQNFVEEDEFQTIGQRSQSFPFAINIDQVSKTHMIPFSVSSDLQAEYRKTIAEKQNQLIVEKVQASIFPMRILLYFFDRVNRRLIVEMQRDNFMDETMAQAQEKAIFVLSYATKKLSTRTYNDFLKRRQFSQRQWDVYKIMKPRMIDLLKIDSKQLESLPDLMSNRSKYLKIIQRHRIIQNSKRSLEEFLSLEVKQILIDLLKSRAYIISIDNKKQLVTMFLLITALNIIQLIKQGLFLKKWQEFEGKFRKIQSQPQSQLTIHLKNGLEALGIDFRFDLGIWSEGETQIEEIMG